MDLALAMAALVAAIIVPGAILAAAVRRMGGLKGLEPSAGEQLFVCAALGMLLDGWLALVLAELGFFSVPAFGAALSAVLLAVALACRLRIGDLVAWRFFGSLRLLHAVLFVAVAASVPLFLRPFEWILGGDDAGTYVDTAASIARGGGIVLESDVIKDAALREHDAFFYSPVEERDPLYSRAKQRFAFVGFFLTDGAEGRVVPQALHLFPALLAVSMALLGVAKGLYALPFFAVFFLAAVFALTRRIAGARAAWLAAAFFAGSFLWHWFARYPASEMLAGPLVFTAMYFFAVAEELDDRAAAALSAVALSEAMLTRVDVLFAVVPFALFILYRSLGAERVASRHRVFALVLVPFFVHFAVHLGWIATPYILYLATYNVLLEPVAKSGDLAAISLAVAGALLALLVAASVVVIRSWPRIGPGITRVAGRCFPALGWGAGVGLVLLMAYAVFVRPRLLPVPDELHAPLSPDGFAAVKLSWYLSPLGLGLGSLGAAYLFARGPSRAKLLLLMGVTYACIYLYNPFQFPDQPQWARKYMTVVVPFALVAAALVVEAAAAWLAGRTHRAVGHGVVLVAAALQIVLAGGPILAFSRYVEYEGAVDAMRALSARMPGNRAVVVFPGDEVGFRLGTPLRFVEGREVVLLGRAGRAEDVAAVAAQVEAWHEAGRQVYLVTPPKKLLARIGLEPNGVFDVRLPEAERPKDRPPYDVFEMAYRLPLFLHAPHCERHAITVGKNDRDFVFGVQDEVLESRGRFYRWTKKLSELVLCPLAADVGEVSVTSINARPPSAPPAEVRVYVNGKYVGGFAATEGLDTATFTFRNSAPVRPVVVGLESTTWIPAAHGARGDDRELGVGLSEVRIADPVSSSR